MQSKIRATMLLFKIWQQCTQECLQLWSPEASVGFVFNNTQRNRENSQPSQHKANICELTRGLRQEKANVPVLWTTESPFRRGSIYIISCGDKWRCNTACQLEVVLGPTIQCQMPLPHRGPRKPSKSLYLAKYVSNLRYLTPIWYVHTDRWGSTTEELVVSDSITRKISSPPAQMNKCCLTCSFIKKPRCTRSVSS